MKRHAHRLRFAALALPFFGGLLRQAGSNCSGSTALLVGSVTEVVDKILAVREVAPFDRLLAQIDIGGLPMAEVGAVIDRFAGQVMPLGRSVLGPTSIELAA